MPGTVLVTGGLGYIGSHVCVALAEQGISYIVLDNLENSSESVAARIAEITGKPVRFVMGDIRDVALVSRLLEDNSVDAVMHFAGSKSVSESLRYPLRYHGNNVAGSIELLECMCAAGVRSFVFSSSATVYAPSGQMPLAESARLGPLTPYGRSKLLVEQVLQDLATCDSAWGIVCLRYFNPIGAHQSGLIGEDPRGIPNNLVPYVARVAVGRLPHVQVFGGDYSTPDGTGIRDFIHVMDLADGHVAALQWLRRNRGLEVCNLGTGRGASVLDVIREYERACGHEIPWKLCARRPGDLAECWAHVEHAKEVLGWRAQYGLDRMCADSWRWQSMNPDGYG